MKRFLEALLLCPALVKAHAASAWIDGPDGQIEILYKVSNGEATICNTYDSYWSEDGYFGYFSYWYGYWSGDNFSGDYNGWEMWDEPRRIINAFHCAIWPEMSGLLSIPTTINGVPVVHIGNEAFHGCSGLTSISIPEGVTSIGSGPFVGCSSLVSVHLPNSITNIHSGAFNGCDGPIDKIAIPGVRLVDNWAIGHEENLPAELDLTGVRGVADSVFSNCRTLMSVTIPDSMAIIGNNAFQGCSSLSSLTIHDGVISIGNYAFQGCSSLSSLTIPDSVTSIGNYAFQGCSSLVSLTISDSVAHIAPYAFDGCRQLTQPVFNQTHTTLRFLPDPLKSSLSGAFVVQDGVNTIWEHAFECCPGITSVSIPSSVTNIGTAAFAYCNKLATVDISDLAAWCEISFASHDANPVNCSGQLSLNGEIITDLVIPYGVTDIGDYAFYGCSALTSVTIPNSVTNIGIGAFAGCSGLSSLTIPNSVTHIGDYAFRNCSGLSSVKVPDSVAIIGKDAFKGTSFGGGNSALFDEYAPKGFWFASFTGDSFDETGDIWRDASELVLRADKLYDPYPANMPEKTTYGYAAFMFMEAGVPYTFNGKFDDFFSVKIDSTIVVSKSSGECREGSGTFVPSLTGWHKLEIRVSNNGGDGGSLNGIGVRYRKGTETTWHEFDSRSENLFRSRSPNAIQVDVLSAQMRESDPTVMDVDYIVYANPETTPTVNVRAVAFEDGDRSFAKVVRPETFIEGTTANLGNGIAANVEHHLAWKVSSDWKTDLAKVKFEVLAMSPDDLLLPDMHFVTIPLMKEHPKTIVSVNDLGDNTSQIFDALLWCYAQGEPDLSLSGGTLRTGGTVLCRGANVDANALSCLFEKMGYRRLQGSELNWINENMRLKLQPSGLRQYAVKTVEE